MKWLKDNMECEEKSVDDKMLSDGEVEEINGTDCSYFSMK